MNYERNTSSTKTCEDVESILSCRVVPRHAYRFSEEEKVEAISTSFRENISLGKKSFFIYLKTQNNKKMKRKFLVVTSLVWRFFHKRFLLFYVKAKMLFGMNAFHQSFSSRVASPFKYPDDVSGKTQTVRRNRLQFSSIVACWMLLHKALRNVWKHRHVLYLMKCFPHLAHENFHCFLLSFVGRNNFASEKHCPGAKQSQFSFCSCIFNIVRKVFRSVLFV